MSAEKQPEKNSITPFQAYYEVNPLSLSMPTREEVWRDLELAAEECRHEGQLNWIAEEYERRKRMAEGAEWLRLEAEAREKN